MLPRLYSNPPRAGKHSRSVWTERSFSARRRPDVDGEDKPDVDTNTDFHQNALLNFNLLKRSAIAELVYVLLAASRAQQRPGTAIATPRCGGRAWSDQKVIEATLIDLSGHFENQVNLGGEPKRRTYARAHHQIDL